MSAANTWIDAVFDWLFASQPVSATFVGRRGYDDAWPDLSRDGIAATAERAAALLGDAPSHSSDRWTALDIELLRRHLTLHVQDTSDGHILQHPALVTGEADFGIVSLLLRSDREADERAGFVIDRLSNLPEMLERGTADLVSARTAERTRALRELDALQTLLTDEAVLALALQGAPVSRLATLRSAARDATGCIDVARERIAALPEGLGTAPVAERFFQRLQHDHFIETDHSSALTWAINERARAQADLRAALDAAGFGSLDDLQAALRADSVSASEYDSTFATVWRRCAEQAVAARLVDWPAWPIVFRPQPRWARAIAPSLYFLLYRCPPPASRQVIQEYLYPPLGDAPDATLAAVNRAQISLNHVIHHAGLGHHVQNWHAFRSPSRVGRVAGTDVATRILLPSSGTLVEGWACRAPELMAEHGFLSDLERLALLHTRLRLAARAVLDIRVNAEGDAAAASEYAATVGATEAVGRDEELRVAMHPGSGIMYLLGQRGLERIAAERGLHPAPSDADLRAFHHEVLTHGAVPVGAIAQIMCGAEAVRPLALGELVAM